MASQGFFSFGDNFDEQIKGRFAGEKENKVAAEYPKKDPIDRMIEALERKNKQLGPGFPKVDDDDDDPYNFSRGHRTSFVSPSGNEVAKFASSDPTKIALNITGSRGRGEIISGDVSDDVSGFDRYLKENYGTGIDENTYKNMPGNLQRILRESYNEDKQKGRINYQEGAFLNQAKPKEDKGNILQRIAGSIFDAATFTQPASAQPAVSTFSETGDPSFRAYRMGQNFADTIKGIGNLPSDYKATEEAAFKAAAKFRDTVSGMSNLPSDYKATEAAAFKGAENFRKQVAEDKRIQGIIDRNPRLTRTADGSVKAVQLTRAQAGPSARTAAGNRARVKANAKARAKAAAVKRRMKKNKKK